MSNSRKKKTEKVDEVEELLRAAEDDMLLKISVDSHMARGSSSRIIDPDLDQRFQALKSRPATSSVRLVKNNPSKPRPLPSPIVSNTIDDHPDDLLARFAALKGSFPSHSSSSSTNNDNSYQQPKDEIRDESEEDEVEKLMKWAIDAARLDPSPPSDTDTDQEEDDDDDDDDDCSEDEEDGDNNRRKRGRPKPKMSR